MVAAATAATALPVLAQTADLEEVVVTARRRDGSFRDVPITVSVFTQQAIESAGIQKPADFIALIPNTTLRSKNLTDKKYNAEFSPGGFLFKALPRRYGLDFGYHF